jgi:predicted Rossmann-fold nucleotide-binding protein
MREFGWLDPRRAKASMGIRVDLPFEQDVNPFVSEVFQHRTFFWRLHHFVLLSEPFVVVPDGIGTVLELAMIWQILHVRKLHRTPPILIGKVWVDLIEWGREHLLRPDLALASREDLDVPHCVDTAQEAVSIIRPRYQEWLGAPARTSA